jgi:TRAP-type C4-dicarboxylate transport system permease small subunit
MQGFVRAADRLAIACAVAASVLLTLAALLITWLVIWRAFGNSAYWELEAAIYMMVGACFLGSPYCLMTKGHVGVDLITTYLPTAWARRFHLFVVWLGLAVCLYLAWKGWLLAHETYVKMERTGSIWNPVKWPLYATMPVGMLLTAFQYIAELLRTDDMSEDTRPNE